MDVLEDKTDQTNLTQDQQTEKEGKENQEVAKPPKEELLFDFSNDFKKKKIRGPPKKKPVQKQENSSLAEESKQAMPIAKPGDSTDVNKDLEDENLYLEYQTEIPRNLEITREEMEKRKFMDVRRWQCMARAQYPKSCGISSLTSCFNYLFSWLGSGNLRPISTEEALEALGFKPPYHNVNFGSFTGNDTLVAWFGLLCRFYKVKGKAKIMWKLHGKGKTPAIDQEKAFEMLKDGLKGEEKAYIYHCWNHYMCPIGFEMTPTKPMDAYKKLEDITELEKWLIIGEISKAYPVFHVKKWSQVVTDIDCQFPKFFNIRKSEVGVQEKTSKAFTEGSKLGGNLHCIIEFVKDSSPDVDDKPETMIPAGLREYAEKKQWLKSKAAQKNLLHLKEEESKEVKEEIVPESGEKGTEKVEKVVKELVEEVKEEVSSKVEIE